LYKLYINTPLQFRYPDCRFAIYALFNKYYFLTGNTREFRESLMQLQSYVNTIKGYRMYENAYFYYLYINTKSLSDQKLYHSAANFLREYVDENLLPVSSRKMVCYYHYLLAIADIYDRKLEAAQSNILLSRNYSAYLDKENYWIPIEESALSVIIQIVEKNQDRLSYETNRFRKLLRKTSVNNHRFWVFFNDWLHLNKRGEEEKAYEKAKELEKLSEQHMKMLLVPFCYIQDNFINTEKLSFQQDRKS
jgi:hypothetical protein